MANVLSANKKDLVVSRQKFLASLTDDDREFLPAALEILETPPSPLATRFITLLGAIIVVALGWSYLGQVDVVAIASGKVQPVGRVKVVQPLETGKVKALEVTNGQHVQQGDVLVQLENTMATADETSTRDALMAWKAEIVRRRLEIKSVEKRDFKAKHFIAWDDDIEPSIRDREQRILDTNLADLAGKVDALQNQALQKREETYRLARMIDAQQSLIQTLQRRVDMKQSLAAKEAGSQASLIDALQQLQTEQATLADQRGRLSSIEVEAESVPIEIRKVLNAFSADTAQKLSEAERQVAELVQRSAKAAAQSSYTVIRSPMSGTVVGLTVTNVGQIVGSGMELMRIVPDSDELEVEAYLKNRDIGFVREGQEALIKVDAFPFTRYGSIDGTVVRLSMDAIPESDARLRESNSTDTSRLVSDAGGQRVRDLVYPVTVRLKSTNLTVDDKVVPLKSGMTVSVEVKTGRRRILEYLLSPLIEVGKKAARER